MFISCIKFGAFWITFIQKIKKEILIGNKVKCKVAYQMSEN